MTTPYYVLNVPLNAQNVIPTKNAQLVSKDLIYPTTENVRDVMKVAQSVSSMASVNNDEFF
jgi:hypothetical protein